MTYVAVTGAAPGAVAHAPEEFAAPLAHFAAEQCRHFGIATSSLARVSHDPATDFDRTLLKAAEELDAGLIVMTSHLPGVAEHLFASHASYVADHVKPSVVVVR